MASPQRHHIVIFFDFFHFLLCLRIPKNIQIHKIHCMDLDRIRSIKLNVSSDIVIMHGTRYAL